MQSSYTHTHTHTHTQREIWAPEAHAYFSRAPMQRSACLIQQSFSTQLSHSAVFKQLPHTHTHTTTYTQTRQIQSLSLTQTSHTQTHIHIHNTYTHATTTHIHINVIFSSWRQHCTTRLNGVLLIREKDLYACLTELSHAGPLPLCRIYFKGVPAETQLCSTRRGYFQGE